MYRYKSVLNLKGQKIQTQNVYIYNFNEVIKQNISTTE